MVEGACHRVDGNRLAARNSVGGNMAAALWLMAHDDGGVNIVYQQLLGPRWTPVRYRVLPRVRRGVSCPAPCDTAGTTTRPSPRFVTPLRRTASGHDRRTADFPTLILTAANDGS